MQNSIRYDGFWPLNYFEFVLGNSPELFNKKNNFFAVANNHFKFDRAREVKVIFSNIRNNYEFFKLKNKVICSKTLSYQRVIKKNDNYAIL